MAIVARKWIEKVWHQIFINGYPDIALIDRVFHAILVNPLHDFSALYTSWPHTLINFALLHLIEPTLVGKKIGNCFTTCTVTYEKIAIFLMQFSGPLMIPWRFSTGHVRM